MNTASRNPRPTPQWLAFILVLGLLAPVVGFEARAATVGVVNINTASAVELELLPGVGPQRAAAIIAARKTRGGFTRPEDLLEVEGIGAVMLERMRPYVALKGGTTARRAEPAARSKK